MTTATAAIARPKAAAPKAAAAKSPNLGGPARADVARAASGVPAKAVGAEASRVTGAKAVDGFTRVEPTRIATVQAPKMTVNTDGAGAREGATYQPRTAFQVGGKYLNAQNQSFLALRPQDTPAGAKMGDPVEVTIKGGKVYDEKLGRDRVVPDRTVYGILGDKKGRHHGFAVEGSKKMHEEAGGTASARSGTINGDIQVRVAVGAGKGLVGEYGSGPGRIPTEAEIQDYARSVFTGR